MYYIDINSVENKGSKEPYETVVKITITDKSFERFITRQLSESPHLINMYYNPLLKIFGFSPVLVSIDSSMKESASQKQELLIDREIRFYFFNKKHRSIFEKKILHSIIKLFDKQLLQYEDKYIIYG